MYASMYIMHSSYIVCIHVFERAREMVSLGERYISVFNNNVMDSSTTIQVNVFLLIENIL